MPILDTVVAQELSILHGLFWLPLRDWLTADDRANHLHLESLRSRAGLGPDISVLRMFDVLTWMTGKGNARRTLHTGTDLLTERQHQRLSTLFSIDEHVQVEATWGIYQRMISAYRKPDRTRGRQLMTELIDALSRGVPAALTELITLGRTLKKRAEDVLAYFDRPTTSNGPTEAISGRLEHLRGSALGFRNLTNYIARSLLETGGFKPRLHPRLR